MSWEQIELGEFITLKRGYDLPERLRLLGEVPIVSSSGVTGSHNKAKVKGPGVVTGRYGTLGEVFYVEKDFWPLNTALYVQDFKGNNCQFVGYYLKNILNKVKSDKAAVPGVNRNDLHARKVFVTRNLKQQEQIVSILSAYDNLIENNRRRIQLLEESARLLHEDWFVRLRFPGHEHTKIVDAIPEGWEKVKLSSLCYDVRNSVHPKTVSSDTPYIGLEHMPRRAITLGIWGTAKEVESQKFSFSTGDILFGKIRPYFHKVGIALVDGITSSDAIVIQPVSENLRFYILMLLSSDFFVNLASKTVKEGSKMPRADWKHLQSQIFTLPENLVLKKFNNLIDPIIKNLQQLANSNIKLAQARDLLLPKLMNEEVRV